MSRNKQQVTPQQQGMEVKPNAPKRPSLKRKREEEDSQLADATKKKLDFENLFIHLGREYYFTSSEFKGIDYFHFRKYDIPEVGKLVPTKTGVALVPSQMKLLMDCAPSLFETAEHTFLDPTIKEYSVHLGFGVYLTVEKKNSSTWVDIRKFFKPADKPNLMHTRKGAMLTREEFQIFVGLIGRINEKFPDLENINPCDCLFGPNQLLFLACKMCNPFDYTNWV